MRMLSDIVVDTNVFMHADNFQELRQKDAQDFLLSLQKSETQLCVDEGFNINEADNRSHIGSEYLKHLNFGMLGYAVVAYLASSCRISMIPRNVPSAIARKIRLQVRNPQDHIFVRVAFNSEDKTLTSHDYNDMSQRVRNNLSADIGVQIISAVEALEKLE